MAEDESKRREENSFIDELALELDGFTIKRVEAKDWGFESLTLPKRLELIRPSAEKYNAVATIWVELPSEKSTLLNLVALSTGRALVRIVEAKTGPDTASELALATRELLAQAYLFSQAPLQPEVEQVVETVKQKVTPSSFEAETSTEDRKRPLGVLSFGEMGGGAYEYGASPDADTDTDSDADSDTDASSTGA